MPISASTPLFSGRLCTIASTLKAFLAKDLNAIEYYHRGFDYSAGSNNWLGFWRLARLVAQGNRILPRNAAERSARVNYRVDFDKIVFPEELGFGYYWRLMLQLNNTP